jgi:hypothetical protein
VNHQPETVFGRVRSFDEFNRTDFPKQADVLILDSGGFSRLSTRSRFALAVIDELRRADLWPATVPTMVLIESLQGHPGKDANANRFLKTILKEEHVDLETARRAAQLQRKARQGSAVDALVVALAEPGGTALTGDEADISALAAQSRGVSVQLI